MATHFELFGLAPSVDLDVRALEEQHRALSMESHPDRQGPSDAHQRRVALERQTALNTAVKVLKDPVRRAFYLLKLAGVDLETESAAEKAKMPLEFLEEVMERREALEGAKARRDADAARAMATEIEAMQGQALERAQAALRSQDIATAAHQLGRVRYFTRFVEEVEALEEELLS